ncbi:MAG: PAS domain-containing protein [Acidobacteria bacterium]|nr:PAS domain-containing protein [Acidobacteriota bacterium]
MESNSKSSFTDVDQLTAELERLRDENNRLRAENSKLHHREAILVQKARLLTLITKATRVGIWTWNVKTDDVHWSDECYQLMGLEPEDTQLTISLWRKCIHTDDHSQLTDVSTASAEGNSFGDYEYRVVWPDGTTRWISEKARLFRDLDGMPGEMLGGVMIDVTDRKLAEVALQESEHRYRTISEITSDYTYSLRVCPDKTLELEWVTEAMFRILGYPKEIISQPENWWQFIHPDDRVLFHQTGESIWAGRPIVRELRMVTIQGQIRWVRDHVRPILDSNQHLVRIIGATQDITEQKFAIEALRRSEAQIRQIIDVIPGAVFQLQETENQPPVFSFVSAQAYDLLGWSTQEIRQLPILGHPLIHADDLELAYRTYLEARQASTTFDLEFRILTRSQAYKWVRTCAVPLKKSPQVVEWVGISFDISRQKENEDDLRYHRELFETIYTSSTDAIFLADTQTDCIIDCNQRGVELFEYPNKTDMIGLRTQTLHKTPLPEVENLNLRSEIQGGQTATSEFEYVTSSGRVFWGSLAIKMISVGGKRLNLVRITDITNRKRIEEEQYKIAKLESLGVLAGGIAHDFNNLLTAIIGNVELVRSFVTNPQKVLARLDAVQRASDRAKGLARQLLTFAKGGVPVREITSLEHFVRDTIVFSLHGSNIHASFEFDPNLWLAEIDPGQMGQVFQNLALNARDAMPMGGELRVQGENIVLAETGQYPLTPGTYIKISVIDHGIGINPEHLPKIFDPYFSTKETGHGLGLAIAYFVVKKHNGYITVRSEAGIGTQFDIFLPASGNSEKPDPSRLLTDSTALKPLNSKRILIMDDEEIVRETTREMLEALGYEIEVTRDGIEAIVCYGKALEARRPFSGVILDLTVPGSMGGQETLVKLRLIDPQVKAIVCSGYSNDPILADCTRYGFSGKLVKPFSLTSLEEACRVFAVPDSRGSDQV